MDIGTGLNGYLGKLLNLKNTKNLGSIDYNHLIAYNPKKVWVFGCPSNKEDIKKNPLKLCDTIKHLDVLEHFSLKGAHIIYASSVGALDMQTTNKEQLLYNQYKAVIEHFISNKIKNFTIFRIPRVLGPNRTKGIIKTIKENKFIGSLYTKINYINENDFCNWIESRCEINGIFEYPNKLKEVQAIRLVELVKEGRLDEL